MHDINADQLRMGSSEWMETIQFRDGKMDFSGESLDSSREYNFVAPAGLVAISLGCFCGVKLSFRRLGLESATLPFDWNRTRIEKVIEFLQTDFAGFLSDLSGPTPIPDTKLTAFRGSAHSFWHDDLEDPDTRVKLQRRIDRFLHLGASAQPKLFVRVLATHDELASADELYAELVAKFGRCNASVYLLVVVCAQKKQQETFISAKSPGLMIFFQSPDATSGEDAAPFCEPIVWALKHILRQGSSLPRRVASAAALLESGAVARTTIGLDGMHGVASFRAMEADKALYIEGARVQAWYWGTWYEATVLGMPGQGCCWKVQCDVDPPGMSTTTHRLRDIPAATQLELIPPHCAVGRFFR
jgi:hypothetical protein